MLFPAATSVAGVKLIRPSLQALYDRLVTAEGPGSRSALAHDSNRGKAQSPV